MQLLQKCLSLLQLRHPNSKINLTSGKAELPFLFAIRVSSIYGTADVPIFRQAYVTTSFTQYCIHH